MTDHTETVRSEAAGVLPDTTASTPAAPDDSEAVRACYRERFGADPTPGCVAALLGVPLAPETKAQVIRDIQTLVHVALAPYLREANALGAALYGPPPAEPAPPRPLTRRRRPASMKRTGRNGTRR